jgi:fumarate reductase subunit C
MSRHRSTLPAWRSPMRGWWRRNPAWKRYMLREATALFVLAFALVLLVGLVQLARGEAAWAAWKTTLASPLMLLLHALAIVAFAYHAWTWFAVMPKTLPELPLSARAITGAGLAASVFATLALLAVAFFGFSS